MKTTQGTVTVDPDKCLGCGTCANVCPFTIIEMDGGHPHFNQKKRCIECLHCAAACPQNAILYRGKEALATNLPSSFSTHFDKDLITHLTRRRSYRHFAPTQVDTAIIKRALMLGDYAPSAKNQHPVSWLVISNQTILNEIMEHILSYVNETGQSPEVASEYELGNNVVMGTAPTLIMGYCKSDAINPLQDTALALFAAELFLQTQGIGTCWAGYLTRFANAVPALNTLFALPAGCQFTSALMAGYPHHEEYPSVPKRTHPSSIKWMK